jgi:hypothetical protein
LEIIDRWMSMGFGYFRLQGAMASFKFCKPTRSRDASIRINNFCSVRALAPAARRRQAAGASTGSPIPVTLCQLDAAEREVCGGALPATPVRSIRSLGRAMVPMTFPMRLANGTGSSSALFEPSLIDAFVEEIRALPPNEKRYWATAAITCFDSWIAVERASLRKGATVGGAQVRNRTARKTLDSRAFILAPLRSVSANMRAGRRDEASAAQTMPEYYLAPGGSAPPPPAAVPALTMVKPGTVPWMPLPPVPPLPPSPASPLKPLSPSPPPPPLPPLPPVTAKVLFTLLLMIAP